MPNRKKIAQARAISYAVHERKVKAREKHFYDVFPGAKPHALYDNMTRHGAKYKAWCKRAGVEPRRECL